MPADNDNPIGSFTYSSQPHSAPTLKKSGVKNLYRENESNNNKSNVFTLSVMADPRIVRGNTHSMAKKISMKSATEAQSNKTAAVRSISLFLYVLNT